MISMRIGLMMVVMVMVMVMMVMMSVVMVMMRAAATHNLIDLASACALAVAQYAYPRSTRLRRATVLSQR